MNLDEGEGVENALDTGEVVENGETFQAEEQAAPEPPTLEDLAGEMGWSPQDKWKGAPDKWKPAHEFMRSTVDVNHKLGNRLKGLEEQLGNMARTSAAMTERALAKQREELLSQRDEAWETGDKKAFERAEKELQELPTIPQAPTVPQETQDFVSRHSEWWGKDQEATQWAVTRAGELASQGLSPARQVAAVEREMKGLFPDLFPEPKQPAKAAPLNAPGNRGAQVSKKGFSSLPADAQKVALDYEARGVCSREEYTRYYFEDQ